MDWNRRITGVACVVGAALAVLAVGTELSRDRPRAEAANLVAHNGTRATVASPETGGERDDCTATAGFWGREEEADARGERRRVCKRYA